MSKINNYKAVYAYWVILLASLFVACKDSSSDTRIWEPAIIGAVYINSQTASLYDASQASEVATFESDYENLTIRLPKGTDMTELRMRLTPINGELIDFPTDIPTDFSLPRDLKVRSYNDKDVIIKMRVISLPLLYQLYIDDGVEIIKSFVSDNSIVVQVAEGTALDALRVTLNFKNGTLDGFTNGTEIDYSDGNEVVFNVVGPDGAKYPFTLLITDKEVGEAKVTQVSVNGEDASELSIDANGNVQTVFNKLLDFSNATLNIKTAPGDKFIDFENGSKVNLMGDGVTVKLKGLDGIVRTFKLQKPFITPLKAFVKTQEELGYSVNSGAAVCFSGQYVVASSYAGNAGINYYDLEGTYKGSLTLPANVSMGSVVTGLRKIASDDDGNILGVNLAAGGSASTAYHIYKWNGVNDTQPAVYCSFTAANLGFSSPRTSGISVQGSLNGDAVITVVLYGTKSVLKWEVKSGSLVSSEPTVLVLDNAQNFNYYSSIEPYPGNRDLLVGAVLLSGTGSFAGIRVYDNFSTKLEVAGSASDLRLKKINDRVYLAYCEWKSPNHILHLSDVTDGKLDSYSHNMLSSTMNVLPTGANANATNDADIAVIDGKSYAVYIGTNGGIVCLELN